MTAKRRPKKGDFVRIIFEDSEGWGICLSGRTRDGRRVRQLLSTKAVKHPRYHDRWLNEDQVKLPTVTIPAVVRGNLKKISWAWA